ncbi:hypothetical protein [Paraburkholderia sp. C35]|uniref:hypothetical protein n=1 Tax=Paraburkholderia sp. C35 TaxID=2126993 RepID=UPI0013A5A16A|nr:hypothetical protein [Paraburkholderia sp. C35]
MNTAIALASLACIEPYAAVVSAQTTCEHLERSLSQLKWQHPHVDIETLGSRELCFDSCTAEQVRADQFWEAAVPEAVDSIRATLVQYADTTGNVTDIAILGRSQPIVRISRRVGAANCVRDTYLTRTTDGYHLITNSVLDGFSQEAGYCGRSFVYFETWRSRSYAVVWDEGETNTQIVAYRVTPSLEFEKACSIRRTSRTAADK